MDGLETKTGSLAQCDHAEVESRRGRRVLIGGKNTKTEREARELEGPGRSEEEREKGSGWGEVGGARTYL